MKQKFQALTNKLKKSKMNKTVRNMLALAMVTAVTMVAAFAEEAGGATEGVSVDMAPVMSAFSSGISSVIATSVQLITVMLPAVLSFFAVKFVAVKGMAWFKQMNK